jgi:hypothetical protein
MGAAGTIAGATATQANQMHSMGAKQIYTVEGPVDSASGSVLHIELWDQRGAFSGTAVAPGSWTIGGDDASPATCGVCAYLYADVGTDGTPGQTYFATAGSVTLDALRPDTSGSVSGLDFIELDASSAPVTDGCQSSLASADYSAALQCLDNGPSCP